MDKIMSFLDKQEKTLAPRDLTSEGCSLEIRKVMPEYQYLTV